MERKEGKGSERKRDGRWGKILSRVEGGSMSLNLFTVRGTLVLGL